jgi:hypothetical protein
MQRAFPLTNVPYQTEVSRYQTIVTAVAAGVALTLPYWLTHLFDWEETLSIGFIAVPILVVLCLIPILAVTQGDQWLRRCMILGLGAKLASASIYMLLGARLYGWSIDVYGYMNEGSKWANQVRTLGEAPMLLPVWGTNFITMLTGSLELLFGRSFATLAVLFSIAAYWGQYFFYRSFTAAFPKADRKFAAALIFLVPSLVYWTSMVGKDALFCLGTGLATYGFVQISSRLNVAGLVMLFSGLLIDRLARSHIATVVAVAATLAMLLGRNIRGAFGAAIRLLVLPVVLACTVYIGFHASQEWEIRDLQQGVARQERALRDNSIGGSAFSQSGSLLARLVLAPTLLFRPFPWEIRSWQAGLSALEGAWLFGLFWQRRRSLMNLVAAMRQSPLMVYSVIFIFIFVFAMAPGISNFGLLVRQRAMMLPFSFFLLCSAEVSRPAPVRVPLGVARRPKQVLP